jgi:transposase
VALTDEQRGELVALTRDRLVDAVVAARARLLLWRDEGYSITEIADLGGVTRPTVYLWLDRYGSSGVDGLVDAPKSGKPPQVSPSVRSRIVALTRASPPAQLGITHWSSRAMSSYLRRFEDIAVSHNFVADLWREHGLRPHRQGTFKLSKDPAFQAKVADVVGLYLDPPVGAVVLAMDEKTQVQALQRTQPLLPVDFGQTEKRTHDYKRHGVTNLFAALNVGTGQVHGACHPDRTGARFLAFMKKVVANYRGREIHVVLDNLSTHDTPDVQTWLEAHPNVTFHFTPVGSSWLNQAEIFFGVITRQAIRRGSFPSLRALIHRINTYITDWNADCEPFTWTATPAEILLKVKCIHSQVHKLLDNNGK